MTPLVFKSILPLVCVLLFPGLSHAFKVDLNAKDWRQVKGKHFTVVYVAADGDQEPLAILRRAEEYYTSIADRIGYARTNDFWTWDERVPIVYFSSREKFAGATGQPPWSEGFSVTHKAGLNFRMIISFRGQEHFLDSILPHEISHLILHDFMGKSQAPVWFDEGIAQLEERGKIDEHRQVMAQLVSLDRTIPLESLENFNLKEVTDDRQVEIFYAESLYIVDFLIKTYGKAAFQKLCRQLRDGRTFEEALKSAYYPTIGSMSGLQDKWRAYMLNFIHRGGSS